MPSWADGENRYQEEYRGESKYDDPRPRLPVKPKPLRSEMLGRALSHDIFVNGAEISLGAFMEKLAEYGDARVAEARDVVR